MSEYSHTPGPWRTPGNANVVGADQTLVVSVPRPKGPGATDRRNANARLIAAAPELLEACKEAQEAIMSLAARFDARIELSPEANALIAVQSAISKAEGQS